jgi:hypothetical protein
MFSFSDLQEATSGGFLLYMNQVTSMIFFRRIHLCRL